MKIAIMTWFYQKNYGTALQVAALSYYLRLLGFDADVISYIPMGKPVTLKKSSAAQGAKTIHTLIVNRLNRKQADSERDIRFNKFVQQYLSFTSTCSIKSELDNLNNQYDVFICGSDQIWAPTVFNPKYFLDFVRDESKMVAYAPSIGLSTIEDENIRNRMRCLISRFHHLSVREQQGVDIIKELCRKDAEVVLDPTLLLNSREWDAFIPHEIVRESPPYILCYFLGHNQASWHHVKLVSEQLGLPIKVIPIYQKDLKRGYEVAFGVGPADFLDLVRNAAFVCTDSFHGLTFSINYNKPFFVYERFAKKSTYSQNSRIYNLLKIIGLERRLVLDRNSLDPKELICDFTVANCNLEQWRSKSKAFLSNSLVACDKAQKQDPLFPLTQTCCGCGACEVICPQGAVTMRKNEYGFLSAMVEKEKCVLCGLCRSVCVFRGSNATEIISTQNKLYALKSTHTDVLNTSSSGGAAFELSRYFSTRGYDVVGCTYEASENKAIHKRVKSGDIEAIRQFQGSKYLQSEFTVALKDTLDHSEQAIIFGTPCQIAAFDNLSRRKEKRKQFLLVDLICHGIPTQKLWEQELASIQSKYMITDHPQVLFRDKKKGWRERHISFKDDKKTISMHQTKDYFYRFFELRNCLSESCYECPFRAKSSADLRIGDYWGSRFKKDKNGVSKVIALTQQGQIALDTLQRENMVTLQQFNCNEYNATVNPRKPVFYEELLDELDNGELHSIAKRYCLGFEIRKRIRILLYKPFSVLQTISRRL